MSSLSALIRVVPAKPEDFEAIWEIFHAVIQGGDTYVFMPDTPKEEGLAYWTGPRTHPYVAKLDGKIAGTYVIRPMKPGRGSHIANASYMVHPDFQGKGVGRTMGLHSLEEAKKLGFRAMQFGTVVSTNEPAVKLWKSIGFDVVGTIPKAFKHFKHGFVDTYVMFREL